MVMKLDELNKAAAKLLVETVLRGKPPDNPDRLRAVVVEYVNCAELYNQDKARSPREKSRRRACRRRGLLLAVAKRRQAGRRWPACARELKENVDSLQKMVARNREEWEDAIKFLAMLEECCDILQGARERGLRCPGSYPGSVIVEPLPDSLNYCAHTRALALLGPLNDQYLKFIAGKSYIRPAVIEAQVMKSIG